MSHIVAILRRRKDEICFLCNSSPSHYVRLLFVASQLDRLVDMGLIDLSGLSVPRILDVGCGWGTQSLLLACLGFHVTAIDINKRQILFAQQKAERAKITNVHFKIQDITRFEANEQFDIAICSDVLEHISDHKRAVQNVYKLLKRRGLMVVCAPHYDYYATVLGKRAVQADGHIREGYTEESLRSLCCEFQPLDIRKMGSKLIQFVLEYERLFLHRYPLKPSVSELKRKVCYLLGIPYYHLPKSQFLRLIELVNIEFDLCEEIYSKYRDKVFSHVTGLFQKT